MGTKYRHAGGFFSDAAPTGGVTVDTPVITNDALFVPDETKAAAAQVALGVEGVYSFAKDGNAVGLGETVYWDNTNSRVTAVKSTSGNKPCGIGAAAAAAGDSTCDVKLLPALHAAGPIVIGMQSAGTQLAEADTAENLHAETLTIPAELMQAGTRINIKALINVDDNNSTNTLIGKLKWDALLLAQGAAFDAADGNTIFIDYWVNVQTGGASGEFHGAGFVSEDNTPLTVHDVLVDQTDDLTADVTIGVSATWSAGHADNKTTLKQLVAIVYP